MKDNFGDHVIPKEYGTCPVCDGELLAEVYECEISGTPTEWGFHIFCHQTRERFYEALQEATAKKLNHIPCYDECGWSYDDILSASSDAYDYLKTLNGKPDESGSVSEVERETNL